MKINFIYFFFMVFALFLLSASTSTIEVLKEQEDWKQTTGTVTSAEVEVYENPDYDPDDDDSDERYLGRVTFTYEYVPEGGSVVWITDVIEGFSAESSGPIAEGDQIDVIYDPEGSDVKRGTLPTRFEFIQAYVICVISGAILIFPVIMGIRWIYRRTKYDSGFRRVL